MSLKSFGAKIFAKHIQRKVKKWADNPIATQEKVFKNLMDAAQYTVFGSDHHFGDIKTHEDFVKQVPIRDYEALRMYVDRMVAGEEDILWPGKPLYFAFLEALHNIGRQGQPILGPTIKLILD